MPLTVSAAEATEDSVGATSGTTGDCTWTLDDNGVLTISGNGAMVRNYAPWKNLEFTEVVIEDGVTNIGKNVFCNCDKLTAVTIPNSVTIIENSAFDMSPYFVIYGNRGFYAENYAKSHGIPFVPLNQDIAIGKAGNCTWYIEENGILTISGKEIVADQPDTTTTTEVQGGDEEPSTYNESSGQPPIPLPDDSGDEEVPYPTPINHENFSIPDYPDNSAPWGAYEFSEVIIEKKATSIGDYAFSNCSDLNHIMIPDSVTSIGDNAFSNCPNLTIYGSDNSYAKTYANSNNIEFVTVDYCGRTGDCLWIMKPDELIIYGNGAMSGYSYIYYDSVSGDTTTAPWRNSRDTKVTIEDGVTKINRCAFAGLSTITSVSIPESVTSISSDAFAGCRNLTSIDFPNSLTSIGSHAFYDCEKLTSIVLPNSLTSIGESAFDFCEGLTSIDLPNSLTSIGKSAFEDCKGLTSIVLPNSLTSIGSYAFSDCNSLTSIDLPNSLTSIGSYAFSGCNSLTSINIPSSVTKIGSGIFAFCKNLSSITVSEGNEKYDSRNNCNAIIGTASNMLIQGCKNTVIPDTVTGIGSSAFSGFMDITSVTIPESVTKIGESAFRYSGLTSITIPNTVTSIGWYAFASCKDLVSINLPDSITDINPDMFYNCSSLTKVIIPDNVTYIGSRAFGYYEDHFAKKIEGFVIIGHKNSAAQRYADKNGFEFIPFELGEINSDGAIDIRDVTTIQKGLAGLSELSDIQLAAADVNADKAVDVNDATHMQKYLAFLIDELG